MADVFRSGGEVREQCHTEDARIQRRIPCILFPCIHTCLFSGEILSSFFNLLFLHVSE